MFGYIEANVQALSEAELARYRGCYCGLCRVLKERHGQLSRITLTFDMTFLVMLLSSMYEPEETTGEGRCFIHPMKRRSYWQNRFSDYAADMNVVLAYFNCLDDWADEHNAVRRAQAGLLKSRYEAVKDNWPRQCRAIEDCLRRLSAIESSGSEDPDAAANCFGELMGQLFCCVDDAQWGERFRLFGETLGRFIYMMDACVDLEKDAKRGHYNPLLIMGKENISEDKKLAILKLLIGECTKVFEQLPLVQDVGIMRNILYSGVWTRYALALKKSKEDQKLDK